MALLLQYAFFSPRMVSCDFASNIQILFLQFVGGLGRRSPRFEGGDKLACIWSLPVIKCNYPKYFGQNPKRARYERHPPNPWTLYPHVNFYFVAIETSQIWSRGSQSFSHVCVLKLASRYEWLVKETMLANGMQALNINGGQSFLSAM